MTSFMNAPCSNFSSFRLTLDEKATLQMMNKTNDCQNKHGQLCALGGGDPDHIYHIIKVCYSDLTIPYESWKYMSERCIDYTKRSLTEQMRDLPEEDRTLLIENNADVMYTFKTAAHFGEEGQGLASVLTEALKSGKYPLVEKVVKDLNLNPDRPKHVDYHQVFLSPWAETFEMVITKVSS